MRLLIAVPTYRRAELLSPLIAAVRAQTADVDLPARILVVDNDPAGSAASAATACDAAYVCESIPGIAAARQRALDEAEQDELVVMIDDDLVPESGWLRELVRVWQETRATAVMGYVRYVWPDGTDPWIAAGGFMRRDRHPSGTRLRGLATGSVLIDASRVRDLGVRFDVSLGLAGGEDMQFGRDLLAHGGVIVAASESVARDDIPPERTTRAFVRRRTVSQGQTRSRLLARGSTGIARLARRAVQLAGGLIRLAAFRAAAAGCAVRRDTAGNAVMTRRAWFAWGRILGAVGRISPEYARDARPPGA